MGGNIKKLSLIVFLMLFSCTSDIDSTQDNFINNLYGVYFLESYTDTIGNSFGTNLIEGECADDVLVISEESIKYQYDIISNSVCNWHMASEKIFNYDIIPDTALISGIIRDDIGSSENNEGIRFNHGDQWQSDDYIGNYFEFENNELLYVEEFQNTNGVVITCAMVWIKQE